MRGTAAEGRGSSHENVGARVDRPARGAYIDAPVDFEVDEEALLVDLLPDRLDLAQLALDEPLPAEAGIDAHDKHQIDLFQDVIEHLRRSRRVESDSGALAERPDRLEGAVEMRPGFRMDGDDVRPRLSEGLEERIGRRNHQMDVERLGAVRPQRLHHGRADGEVGHEMAVHHIDMDPVGAGFVDGAHLLAEPGEIGREDGGGDADGLLHARTLTLPESRGKERARLIPALLGVAPASGVRPASALVLHRRGFWFAAASQPPRQSCR